MKILILLFGFVFPAAAHGDSKVPVMVGGNEGLDACLTLGAVVGHGDSKEVTIYSKPDKTSPVVKKLPSGTHVMICDSSGGDWLGVVFSGEPFPSCDLSSFNQPRQPYTGKCDSGWVKKSEIEFLAG